jgi:putative aldouronate transport system permease protein
MVSFRSSRIIIAILVVLSIITIFPFWYVLIQSLSDPVTGAKAWIIPKDPFIMNYRVVFTTPGIGKAYFVTVARVATGVPLYLLVTGMTAFVFTRKELKGRNWLLWLYIIVMYFDGGLIAFYVWMRSIHLYNTFFMYILPACYGMWAMIVMKTAIKQIPDSLMEAALMDGAGYFQIFYKVVVPLSLPMFATMGLFQAVAYWNDWFTGAFYMSDPEKWPLQTFLQLSVLRGRMSIGLFTQITRGQTLPPQEAEQILKLNSISMETAYIIVSIVPILLIYPWVQKYFVKGVMIGSIKE